MSAIPLADAPALRPAARITFAATAALAAAACALAVAFLLVSRTPHTQTLVPLPAHADTILTLDLSASISEDTYSRIGGTLAALSRSHARFGLVLFSDQAYEALPPGSPAADLAPFVRYFTLPQQTRPGFVPTFPANPWQQSFSGGTRISAGMELAHRIAAGGGRRATVVLVSDLDDNPSDLARLSTVMLAFRRDRIPVRVVGLNPSPSDVDLFRKLTQPQPVVTEAPTLQSAPLHDRTPFPWVLVALTCAIAAVVAAAALWAPPLEWGRA